jgi:hypothetical protein
MVNATRGGGATEEVVEGFVEGALDAMVLVEVVQ